MTAPIRSACLALSVAMLFQSTPSGTMQEFGATRVEATTGR